MSDERVPTGIPGIEGDQDGQETRRAELADGDDGMAMLDAFLFTIEFVGATVGAGLLILFIVLVAIGSTPITTTGTSRPYAVYDSEARTLTLIRSRDPEAAIGLWDADASKDVAACPEPTWITDTSNGAWRGYVFALTPDLRTLRYKEQGEWHTVAAEVERLQSFPDQQIVGPEAESITKCLSEGESDAKPVRYADLSGLPEYGYKVEVVPSH